MVASAYTVRLEAGLDWEELAQRLGTRLDASVVAHPPSEGTNGGSLIVDGRECVELLAQPSGVGIVSYDLSPRFLEWATIAALESLGGEFEGEVPQEMLVTLAEYRRRAEHPWWKFW